MSVRKYIISERPNPLGKPYYCPQPLLYIIFAPLTRAKRFDDYMISKFGRDYLTFYTGRNGVYHILEYLKRDFGSRRIFLPDAISPTKSYSMIVASNKAGYKILYYKTYGPINGLRKSDVVLLLDSTIKLPEHVFSIEDNALNPTLPSRTYDFTLYSFAIGKPLASGRGGLVVVNRERVKGFLKLKEKLVRPDALTELKNYYRYLFWYKIKNLPAIRKVMRWEALHKKIKGGTFTREYVIKTDYAMCSVSKKIAAYVLR